MELWDLDLGIHESSLSQSYCFLEKCSLMIEQPLMAGQRWMASPSQIDAGPS